MTTVRDASFDVMRRHGMTTVFGNPGSTEIPFLSDFPDDLGFVLALHEGAVVGIATGYALGTGRPAFVNLHTAPGLGNAVNAIACARDNRIPLVIVVGQQDRRQLAFAPFLTGRSLDRLAGDYPVWTTQPATAADVPGAIARATHEAAVRRGPAIVVVPSSDWAEPLDDAWAGPAAPDRLLHGQAVDPVSIDALAELLAAASAPALVVGAGLDTPEGWEGVTALAERLACPVWQDTFSSRAGFPQDHELFAGHLPWQRSALRETFAGNDLVLAAGTLAFRLYLYDGGPLVPPGTRVAVVSDDPEDVQRSRCDLAVLASPGKACAELAARMPRREGIVQAMQRPAAEPLPAPGEALRAVHVLDALATRLPRDVILVEESPSTRPEMLRRIAVRSPLGFVAVANGALGFGLSSAIGLRLALPQRPVVALLGDGSSMYTVQALWTAASYGVGVVVIVIANGRYAVMDELAQLHGAPGAWPSFGSLELATIAAGMGCAARRIATHDELVSALDETMPTLHTRTEPLLLDVHVR